LNSPFQPIRILAPFAVAVDERAGKNVVILHPGACC
jgi:hypothetical protein